MPRPRTKRRDLPPAMYYKHGAYYHVVKNKWHNLGRELVEALREYHKRELTSLTPDQMTFSALRTEYLAKGTKDLAPRTVKDYTKHSGIWAGVFDGMLLSEIEPHHIKKQHRVATEKRGNVQANREKATFSLIWNWGRSEGLTKLPNPCTGIRRATERSRDVLVSDSLYRRVWIAADWQTRDIMDLARYTAQRPADVLALELDELRGDTLLVEQGKTRRRVRIAIEGKLKAVCDRILARGTPLLTPAAFDNRFEDARRKAGVDLHSFQFRDLRAKGLTRKADKQGKEAAQKLGGHSTVKTTEIYVNRRVGEKVRPVE